jgi:hypothetical protein
MADELEHDDMAVDPGVLPDQKGVEECCVGLAVGRTPFVGGTCIICDASFGCLDLG